MDDMRGEAGEPQVWEGNDGSGVNDVMMNGL
jgi:hypothetical protein